MGLLAACTDLAGLLTAGGIPASVERSRVQTPGAWVSPQMITELTLDGGGTGTADVVLVTGDTGELNALTALSGLLTTLITLPVAVAGPIDTSWALVLTGSPLPAFRVPVTIDF